MKNKKNFKGFTLVELIVVMAVFGIIMLGAMQFLDPVSKMMKGASLQESNSAAVDNMKRYFEGTLRYANAVDVYGGCSAGFDKKQASIDFVDKYYTNRVDSTDSPVKVPVHVMTIHNDDETGFANGEITESLYNVEAGYTYKTWDTSGTIPVWTYTDPANPLRKNAEILPIGGVVYENQEVINKVYYKDYSMFITLGYNEMNAVNDVSKDELPAELGNKKNEHYFGRLSAVPNHSFGAKMFSFTFTTYKNDRDSDGNPIYRRTVGGEELFVSPYSSANASLALININSAFGDKNRASFGFCPERRIGSDGTKSYSPSVPVKDDDGKVVYESNPYVAGGYFDYIQKTEGNDIFIVYTITEN